MSRMPLVEPDALPPYLKTIHDATPQDNWLGRNFARVFGLTLNWCKTIRRFTIPGTQAHPADFRHALRN